MISVCILVKNRQETLSATLQSLKHFPEVVLLDTGSTDRTLEIAKTFPNVKVVETVFRGFGELRNEAAAWASHDWILAIDSDEILSPALIQELAALELNPACAYSMPRHNFYNQKRIRGCGWAPDRVTRLYHRRHAHFGAHFVHESLIARKTVPLRSPLFHTPYRSTADFLAKMQHYSTLFAAQYKGRRKSSLGKALFHAGFAFLRSYILKRGFLDGSEGFVISLYNANTTFYKYLKLSEVPHINSDGDETSKSVGWQTE